MNHQVPEFLQMEDVYSNPTTSRSKNPATDGEGVTELLWENGHVVMQNQRPQKKAASGGGGEVVIQSEREIRFGGEEQQQQLFMQEDEMASWLQYPLDDLYADLLYPPPPPPAPVSTITQSRVVAEIRSPVPANRPPVAPTDNAPRFQNFGYFSRFPGRPRAGPVNQPPEVRESTVVESNETPMLRPPGPRVSPANVESGTATAGGTSATAGELAAGTCEQTVTSSSCGGSRASLSASGEGHQPQLAPEDRKRKARENDDNEYHSEDIEFEAAEAKEPEAANGSTSAKRSRVAEVHNLSERRRRDKINVKMKALQDLIPRCKKSDKASMLDEAIEYVKSLQMQLQMMSMGCPMVPVMYPGMQQQYMPAMGMNRPMIPYHPSMIPSSSIPNPAYMSPRLPMLSPYPMPQVHMPDPRIHQASSYDQADHVVNFSQYQNQPGLPNYLDPYQQFVGMHQGQYPMIPQNQAVLQPGSNRPITSKELGNPDSQFG